MFDTGGFLFGPMISFPTSSLAASAVNHLLSTEAWARHALQQHAGKLAMLDAGIVAFRWTVGADGLLSPADPDGVADVVISIKPADIPLVLRDREHAFSYVTIQGDAGFAAVISQLAETLRWEAEADLAPIVGDIAAVRIVRGTRSAVASIRAANQTLAENVAEYLADEKPVLVRTMAMEQFREDTVRLRDDVERLSKRIERLKRSLDA